MSEFTIGPRTLSILKNFMQINKSIVFSPGNTLATITHGRTIFARASIEEQVPVEFAVYELSRFLQVLSLFDNPTIEFDSKCMTISSGRKRTKYTYSSVDLVIGKDGVNPYKTTFTMPKTEVTFKLPSELISDLRKAVRVLGVPEIAIIGDGNTIAVEATNSGDPTADVYSIEVGKTDKEFKFYILAENFCLLDGDYTVDISSKKMSHFKGDDVEYFIACEKNSSYTNG